MFLKLILLTTHVRRAAVHFLSLPRMYVFHAWFAMREFLSICIYQKQHYSFKNGLPQLCLRIHCNYYSDIIIQMVFHTFACMYTAS